MRSLPLLLLILDGWGYRAETENNAIALANTPIWDNLWENNPHTLISCSGNNVGLPSGQMGNSEVGHITMGSGRVVFQDLTKINLAINEGNFFKIQHLNKFIEATTGSEQALHIMGLLSPGGVHSHEDHIHAALQLAAKLKTSKVYIHAFLDGRDTPPTSAKDSLLSLQNLCEELKVGEIASITGRFYAMDRDSRFERTKQTYDLLMSGEAEYTATDAITALEQAYARGETDEFIKPTLISNGENRICIANNDHILFMNFRADRTRQLCRALTEKDFVDFNRGDNGDKKINLMTLTKYAEDLDSQVVFPKDKLVNTIGECLQKNNLSQLRIAETEKYAHVTFFFNGGSDNTFTDENRILIPSPKVKTYDLQPEMSAHKVTMELLQNIDNKSYDVIICNFANADMVGHTGNLAATIKAVETIDKCIGKIISSLNAVGGEILITADHGNAEQMHDAETKQPHTAHTTSPIPVIYAGNRQLKLKQNNVSLADIAPTVLNLLEIEIPNEMTGSTLITS